MAFHQRVERSVRSAPGSPRHPSRDTIACRSMCISRSRPRPRPRPVAAWCRRSQCPESLDGAGIATFGVDASKDVVQHPVKQAQVDALDHAHIAQIDVQPVGLELLELPAVKAGQAEGRQPVPIGPVDGLQHIGAIARTADRDDQIARLDRNSSTAERRSRHNPDRCPPPESSPGYPSGS